MSARPPLTYLELGDQELFPVSILKQVGGSGGGGNGGGGNGSGGSSGAQSSAPQSSRLAKGFAALGIETILDLLTFYPRRHIHRHSIAKISHIYDELRNQPGRNQEFVVLGRIASVEAQHRLGSNKSWNRGQRKARCTIVVEDDSDSLTCTFFNQPWRARQFHMGMELYLTGKVKLMGSKLTMANPVVDILDDDTGDGGGINAGQPAGPGNASQPKDQGSQLVAIYPQSAEAKQNWLNSFKLGQCVQEALRRAEKRGLADPVPADIGREFGLIGRTEAMRAIHVPESEADLFRARRRLAFDELFRTLLWLLVHKRRRQLAGGGFAHQPADPSSVTDPSSVPNFVDIWRKALPFKLTDAQKQAIEQIREDMAQPWPMRRLLQGDVGSGKTAVSMAAMLTAVACGHQAAIMAPTEILAEQIYFTACDYLQKCASPDGSSPFRLDDPDVLGSQRDLRVELLTSGCSAAERSAILSDLAQGKIDIAVGTHALLQADVAFRSLSLVVIDEQQRFGVEQRAVLQERASGGSSGNSDGNPDHRAPDLLVMTGTPIPRTTAMTILGDLDITELDELPLGRSAISTHRVRHPEQLGEMWQSVRQQLQQGRQAFVVCPLIHQQDEDQARLKLDGPGDLSGQLTGAIATHNELSQGELAQHRVGLLHGQMKTEEKEAIMERFRSGELQALVATTIVEVGVDIPNAAVMVIMDAQMFGLAQLHQLRGRVGRGGFASECFLVGEADSEEGERRLDALCASTDGFELAKQDLEIRGEGTVMGEKQSGRGGWKLASLVRDEELVRQIRTATQELVSADPEMERHRDLWREVEFMLRDEATEFLQRT